MHIDLQNVGQRLEAVREALGLQKGEFAQSFDVDPSSYSKIIKGEKPLKADMAFMIAEKWGISMDYLYRGRLSDLPASVAEKLRKS
jgi:transcriptional regulator with XRE-family HTH domain